MESRMRGNVQVRFGEGDTPHLKGSTVPTLLSDGERKTLAAIGQKPGKQALEEVANIVKPDTIAALPE